MPSALTPELRWQIVLTYVIVNGDGRFFGSMTM
jgi:hypothetical protein